MMNGKSGSFLSRRQFAHRAAALSVTAVVPSQVVLPALAGALPQTAENAPQLSPQGQREANSRYEQILSLYGDRLDEAQKANIKKMCMDLQPALERVRAFKLENGNAPALYLKPLVERENKPHPPVVATKP